VTDDLYQRYMKAFKDFEQHTANCTACQNGQPCEASAAIRERFARLQDAYRDRQSQQRR
jgi:DNA-binding FadR family transcriptional regulator